MECKDAFWQASSQHSDGINRNIVECKERLRKIGYYGNIVLIETLWNVKWSMVRFIPMPTVCINRNIVECKGRCYSLERFLNSSINRNIVECKGSSFFSCSVIFHPVLIETLWNVKQPTPLNMSASEFVLIETLWNVKCVLAIYRQ